MAHASSPPGVTSLGETSGTLLKGAVTLTEGTGVTITTSGQAITLAASGGATATLVSATNLFDSTDFDNLNVGNSGANTFGTNGLSQTTGATGTSYARVTQNCRSTWPKFEGNSRLSFGAVVVTAPTDGSAYWGTSYVTVTGTTHTYTSVDHYGFKLTYASSTGTLSADNNTGSSETATDISSGITLTNVNIYSAKMTDSTNIKFYIGRSLKATHITNLPSGTDSQLFQSSISNNATAVTYAILTKPYNFAVDVE